MHGLCLFSQICYSRLLQQIVTRHMGPLRRIYNTYSSLGHASSQDNAHIMSALQLWRFFKDCRIHELGIELAEIDRLLGRIK